MDIWFENLTEIHTEGHTCSLKITPNRKIDYRVLRYLYNVDTNVHFLAVMFDV